MKFQNISIYGSKVKLYTRKRDEQNKQMNRQARSNMAPNFFQSWGIKRFLIYKYFCQCIASRSIHLSHPFLSELITVTQ